MWSAERDTVIAKDEIEHGHTFTAVNSTCRKIVYHHMFIFTNGGYGQKGIRKWLSGCVRKESLLSSQTRSTWDSEKMTVQFCATVISF